VSAATRWSRLRSATAQAVRQTSEAGHIQPAVLRQIGGGVDSGLAGRMPDDDHDAKEAQMVAGDR
jgi:hypothetical protein